ncbi:sialidase-3-like [Salminus brasiliensis]|uniref:sialidase-3-like n=1 Tax=Salminus brasiliensis TaxID=930266 RepID=UPI003B836C5A
MANTSSQPSLNLHLKPQTVLFKKEGKITYRIPALIYISESKTFLAFAEKRRSPNDKDADVLVMRKGLKKGCSVKWSPVQELNKAILPHYRSMNPCPVYKSNTLFLFFICVYDHVTEHDQRCSGKNQTRLCCTISRDQGETWEETTDLTESVIGEEYGNWATFGVGPGHGIQMKNGRLIIPAYAYYIDKKPGTKNCQCITTSHALAFYSDNDGETWKKGGKIQTQSNECQMAELIDQEGKSKLYCNARTPGDHRVEAWSGNSSEIAFDINGLSKCLVETDSGCQGSVLSFHNPEPAKEESSSSTSHKSTWLLYSHPSHKKHRKNLALYLNRTPLETSGWENVKVICEGHSGYSDLTQCEETFACLMECGEKSEVERISFLEFSFKTSVSNQDKCCCCRYL